MADNTAVTSAGGQTATNKRVIVDESLASCMHAVDLRMIALRLRLRG
jgi:hypothetical protein